jgi:hypothetical protein
MDLRVTIHVRYMFLYSLQNSQKLFEITYSMLNAQLTTLLYRSTNWLARSNLNIIVNTRECFRSADFGVVYIFKKYAAAVQENIFLLKYFDLYNLYVNSRSSCNIKIHKSPKKNSNVSNTGPGSCFRFARSPNWDGLASHTISWSVHLWCF